VLECVIPQTSAVLINSNSPPELFAGFGWPVLPDVMPGFQGPLAGLLTGLHWAAQSDVSHVLSVACDTPFLPPDLVKRLGHGLAVHEIAIARDAERSHPVIGLWPTVLTQRLAHDMAQHDIRGVHQWLRGQPMREVVFEARHFRNLNTREDLHNAFQSNHRTQTRKDA
jgi:molybdopterin-guanine dinucleotide biosynthesis protein A